MLRPWRIFSGRAAGRLASVEHPVGSAANLVPCILYPGLYNSYDVPNRQGTIKVQ